jgi:hypothetical protein
MAAVTPFIHFTFSYYQADLPKNELHAAKFFLKLMVTNMLKKFSIFYGTCMFFILFCHHNRKFGYTIHPQFLTTCFSSLSHSDQFDFYIHLYMFAIIPIMGQCLHTGILDFTF